MGTEPQLARRSQAVGLAKAALVRGQALAGVVRGGPARPWSAHPLLPPRLGRSRSARGDAGRLPAPDGRARGERAARRRPLRDRRPRARARRGRGRAHVRRRLPRRPRARAPRCCASTASRAPSSSCRARSPARRRSRGTPPARCRRWPAGTSCGRGARAGLVHFEPHTITHPVLTTLAREDAYREIMESKDVVEHELGRPARIFCYPGGYYSPREVELVRECGFRAALTCEFGANHAAVRPQRAAAHDRRALRSAVAVPRAARRRDRRTAARPPHAARRAPRGVTPACSWS